MYEKVFAAVIGSYETVSFLLVEPFDCSLRHSPSPAFLVFGLRSNEAFLLLRPQYTKLSRLEANLEGDDRSSRRFPRDSARRDFLYHAFKARTAAPMSRQPSAVPSSRAWMSLRLR